MHRKVNFKLYRAQRLKLLTQVLLQSVPGPPMATALCTDIQMQNEIIKSDETNNVNKF